MFKFLHRTVRTSFRSYSCKHGRILKGALEKKSIRQNVGWVPRNGYHVIHTLDPNKFAEKKQQRLNIGGKYSFRPQISLPEQSIPLRSPCLYYGKMTGFGHVTYPPDTKSFLYYSIPHGKPRIAGELRLRVASSDDLTSFESGSDLLLTNGRTWMHPLCTLPNRYLLPLYKKLREDQLIPDDLDAFLSTLPAKSYYFRRSHLFHTLHDTFIVDFSAVGIYFLVITEQGLGKLSLQKLFFDMREMCKHTPYTGSALARLERSTLSEHKGTRTVVLRFLKIITPVKCVVPSYDGYVCFPKEGELHKKSVYARPHPWSANIDKPNDHMSRGLQLLWDT